MTHIPDMILRLFEWPLSILGILIISFIANSIPFVAIPYLAVIMTYSLLIQDLTSKLVISLASAFGASLGKLVIYSIGGIVRLGFSEKTLKNLDVFNRIAGKSLFLAIFLFASLPLPDDILYIPVGIIRYSIVKYFIAVLSGKVVMTTSVVLYVHTIMEVALEFTTLIPIYLVLTIVLSYIIIKVDWSEVLDALTSKGLSEGLKVFTKQLGSIFKIKLP